MANSSLGVDGSVRVPGESTKLESEGFTTVAGATERAADSTGRSRRARREWRRCRTRSVVALLSIVLVCLRLGASRLIGTSALDFPLVVMSILLVCRHPNRDAFRASVGRISCRQVHSLVLGDHLPGMYRRSD